MEGLKAFIILNYILFYDVLEKQILVTMVWGCRGDPAQVENILKS